MKASFQYAIILATMMSTVIAVPQGSTTTTNDATPSTIGGDTVTPSSTTNDAPSSTITPTSSTTNDATPSTTITPTAPTFSGGPCGQAGSSGGLSTVWATWPATHEPAATNVLIVDGKIKYEGQATADPLPTDGFYILSGTPVAASAMPNDGTITASYFAASSLPTFTADPNVTPTPGVTTVYPNADNGGIYISATKTYSQSGGGEATTATTKGWFWPTGCAAAGTGGVNVPLEGSSKPKSNLADSDALNQKEGNGARSLGPSGMMLAAVVGIVGIAL